MQSGKYHFYFIFLYLLLLVVYVLGMCMPLMELDSAQHATMAMRMVLEDDYWNIIKSHQPYLDKPHMHFWLAALSFKLLGICEFTYRLPAALFLWGGAFATFRLGRLLYSSIVGHFAALIFLASQTIILSAHDVRTDAVLTGATILAIWQLTAYLKNHSWQHLVLGALFTGIAFSTKGLIALVVIGLCIFCYLLYSRQWSAFFHYKTLVGVGVLLLSISPLLYAYYQQFDQHPELVINGETEVSGISFILWDQVFNRLNAVGFSETSPDYFFFFHTLLWAFLPFALLGYVAIFARSRFFLRNHFRKIENSEFLTLGGVLSVLLLISFSKFKLPHYLNIIIPVLSLLTASYLVEIAKYNNKLRLLQRLLIVQYLVVGAIGIVGLALGFYVFGFPNWLVAFFSLLGLLVLLGFVCQKRKDVLLKILVVSVLASVWANFNLNATFYPRLLEYQGGRQLAALAKERAIDLDNVYLLKGDYNWSFDFYTRQNTKHIGLKELQATTQPKWVVTDEGGLQRLLEYGLKPKETIAAKHFHVTRLKGKFLNPKTRTETLHEKYLLRY